MKISFDEKRLASLGYRESALHDYMFKVIYGELPRKPLGRVLQGAVFVYKDGGVAVEGDMDLIDKLLEELEDAFRGQCHGTQQKERKVNE